MHQYWNSNAFWLHRERTMEAPHLVSPWIPPSELLPLTNFNLFPPPIINHNHEYNRVLWVLVNYWNWGWFGEPPTRIVAVRSEGGLVWTILLTLQLAKFSQWEKVETQYIVSILPKRSNVVNSSLHWLGRRAQSYAKLRELLRNEVLVCLDTRLNCLRKFVTGLRWTGCVSGVFLGALLKSAMFWGKE